MTAALFLGCGRSSGATDPCTRTHGVWQGESILIEGDAGRDPDAVRVVTEMIRGERWRLVRVTPNAMQRERQGLAGGPPVGEAMYLTENANGRCVVELRTPHNGTRAITFTPHNDGTLDVLQQGGWYTARFRRP